MKDHGYGTVYYDKSKSKWVAAVELTTPTGERKRKTFRGRTREDVEARLSDYRDSHPAPTYVGRRELKARNGGHHTRAEWLEYARNVGLKCEYCGVRVTLAPPASAPNHMHADHRIPLIRGGSDNIENIAVCCHACNLKKAHMTEIEYREWRATNA